MMNNQTQTKNSPEGEVRYEKEIGECQITVYKFNTGELDQYAKLFLETEKLLRIDIYDKGVYKYSKYALLDQFLYAQSFKELEKYPAYILGLLIWGS